MTAYYNEIDPAAAAWLRELIKAGHIAPGIVDERSIEDVFPDDLRGFTQCHFFAGIGVWSYALRRAGWPDDRPVWTGSCPCQPFSAAGKGAGFADERHLWPAFHHLIRQCRPATVLGEQVASQDGLVWFDLVQADMEGEGYACAAVDTCAAGFGAPHIRQRLYWVGHANNEGSQGRGGVQQCADQCATGSASVARGLGQPNSNGCESGSASAATMGQRDTAGADGGFGGTGPTNGHWADVDWLFFRDGKWRPVEPGTFPLVDGASERVVRSSNPGAPIDAYSGEARVMRLRGYGNAINSEAAINFVRACKESIQPKSEISTDHHKR